MKTGAQTPNAEERYLGCLLGLAAGDAVGTTVEFMPRGAFQPLTDMVGGGPFRLAPGQWTDDTSMALCLAESLIERGGFDPTDQMRRYVRWWREGYLSSTGECFDIGNTVADALRRFEQSGEPYSGSTDPYSAGNGSIMRLAPVPMFYADDLRQVVHYAGESSRTTHGAQEAVDASRLFGAMIALALQGEAKVEVLFEGHRSLFPANDLAPAIRDIAEGGYRAKGRDEIKGSGYVVRSLEAALWCFWQTDSYQNAVLLAANLGDDADTTAAVCGQIAGAYYGVGSIPETWLVKLARRALIQDLARQLSVSYASRNIGMAGVQK
ncbi:MAG TPA: ADP-ribosylglycohydrolase family protein [Caldilineae bacterium]|nr:ADP-ribosylglycohydrolase family protein [Caldilineae bacterium]